MINLGLRIKSVDGSEQDVWGVVTWKIFENEGKIYYCGGYSYMEACVVKVYSVNKTAEEIYKHFSEEQ